MPLISAFKLSQVLTLENKMNLVMPADSCFQHRFGFKRQTVHMSQPFFHIFYHSFSHSSTFVLLKFSQTHLILFIRRLKALYDIRPKADEIELITKYQQDNPKGTTR